MIVVGTRPEAIKLAPVLRELRRRGRLEPVVVSTGQHSDLLDQTLAAVDVRPDVELRVMTAGQSPNDVVEKVMARLPAAIERLAPAVVLVQGDTTTVLAAALVAYHLSVPVAHVEAGLRTWDEANPFPEEMNRQLVDRLSRWCFAPTDGSRDNLLREAIPPERIHVTGNTAVDAILWAFARSQRRLPADHLLVTLHRRESFGECLREILAGIRTFLDEVADAEAIWPVHPNPSVRRAAEEIAGDCDRFHLEAPVDYLDFAGMLGSCRLVITDSGGIQEEAPSLGCRALVARETTERPEGVEAGINRIVGRTRQSVRDGLVEAWRLGRREGPLPHPSPYGDGRASERIADILESACAGGAVTSADP